MIAMILFAGAGVAQAQSSRLYFAGYLGLSTSTESEFSETTTARSGDMEFDNGVSLAAAMGLRLTPQWRIETEISKRGADFDRVDFAGVGGGSFKLGGELDTWLYLLNVYYDFDWEWKKFQPFLTAGIGLASQEATINDPNGLLPTASDDSLGFAWSLGGGLKYRVDQDVAITTNYRYIGANDMEVDSYDVEYSNHEFRLGLEYDLPMDWFGGSWFD